MNFLRACSIASAFLYLACLQGAFAQSADEKFSDLRAFAQKSMAETAVPGVAIGVLHNGETFTTGLGVTNVDHPLGVDADTLFQVGSITKTMTGTILMRLVEQGKVNLDVPVSTYVPEFKVVDGTATETATVRHLLTHMGGWVGDYFNPTGEGDDSVDRMIIEMADLEQLASIGTVWSYNNSGFYVAVKVIENVTGKTYEAVFEEMILADLGLDNTYIRAVDVMTLRFATGHTVSESGVETAEPWALYRAAVGVGGAIMTAGDMLKYAAFHMGDGSNEKGQQIMSVETLQEMQDVHAAKLGSDDSMGITWHISDVDSVRTISHGGGTVGQISRLVLVPEHDFALAVVTNANSGSTAATKITRFALEHYLGAVTTDPEPTKLTDAELADYVGTWSRPFMDINVSPKDGHVELQVVIKQSFPDPDTPPQDPGPPAEFGFFEKDRLVAIGGPAQAEFIRREDGSIGWLRLGSRIHVRQ